MFNLETRILKKDAVYEQPQPELGVTELIEPYLFTSTLQHCSKIFLSCLLALCTVDFAPE